VFMGFKKGVKGYKIWVSKNKKNILSKDVTFDEASMVKSMNSQQVENENTNRISQQVESDATPSSPDSLVLLKITLNVIEGDDHVADEDAYDDEDQ